MSWGPLPRRGPQFPSNQFIPEGNVDHEVSNEKQLETFFRLAFGPKARGFLCIALLSTQQGQKKLTERFFDFPAQIDEAIHAVQRGMLDSNVYYCPMLFSERKRRKDTVAQCPTAWADLDSCDPEKMKIPPTIAIESSPGRFQALWRFAEPQAPHVAEDVSRKIAYYHASDGADRSGWDLTQLLRVPSTPNYKYSGQPTVTVSHVNRGTIDLEAFDVYPEIKHTQFLKQPMPTGDQLPKESALELFVKYRNSVLPAAYQLFQVEPEGSWSENLWKLEMMCFEGGMTKEEVFVCVQEAACNKYKRDGRDVSYLWVEVCRAALKYQENVNAVFFQGASINPLMDADEQKIANEQEGFIERYIEWAGSLGDAATQYHQAGAFTILSALLSGRVTLPTSYGNIVPNLWFMILGDTTLTRKSTAMDIAIDLVLEVDPDAVMATDGSIEGLMQQLEARPKRPSIFLRDEFSGLLEMITKKDYYAGMAEVLTKLYDGKMQKRVLRKETVTVRDPILLILAGGIRNRVQALLTHEHVSSGFIPRFIFVTAESDTSRIKPLGPPTGMVLGNRGALIDEMQRMVDHYGQQRTIHIKALGQTRPTDLAYEAHLSQDAWLRYNQLESDLLQCGLDSEKPDLMTPLFDRLAKSTLKSAVLLAAARQYDQQVRVEVKDILHAIRYTEQWRSYAIEVVNGIGKTVFERDLEKILRAVHKRPGIGRAQLMQSYHLTARQADQVFDTLIQRGQITLSRTDSGRQVYFPSVGMAGANK